jgi:nicotinate-nucleotide pyrophosphorylase (carboxylating)
LPEVVIAAARAGLEDVVSGCAACEDVDAPSSRTPGYESGTAWGRFLVSCSEVFAHPRVMDDCGTEHLQRAVDAALEEDVGAGDVTTLATVPPGLLGVAMVVAREPMVVAGLAVAEMVWRRVSPDLAMARIAVDGARVEAEEGLMRVSGPVGAILTGERVALNFVQRLSGVATLTRQYVEAVAGSGAVILDTRKTTPGLRVLEKCAVRCGGGQNHRMGLYDAVLIKDNHLAALRNESPSPIAAAVARARQQYPGMTIEVEADTVDQVEEALRCGVKLVLLDNMSLEDLRRAVRMARGKAKTEASGGVNLETVRAIAETGVDYISVGALTHSARAMDVALDWADE